MKVLWLTNKVLSDKDTGATGTWLEAMAQLLMRSGGVELGGIAPKKITEQKRADFQGFRQWVIPFSTASLGRDSLPPKRLIEDIQGMVREFSPDLIHVWGTESFWGLLTARQLLPSPALLEIQGLKMTIADVFYGGLSVVDRLRCIGIKEILKRRIMWHERREFERWGKIEREMIGGHHFIDFQSPWVAAQVKAVNPHARLFKADRALRAEFESAAPWKNPDSTTIFCACAYPSPFKGLHVAIQAAAALRQRYPDIRLRIAGPYQRSGIRLDGYVRWLNALIAKLGMQGHVEWLGTLSAVQLVQELQSASAALIPTYVESYCVTMVEAMRIGTPTVAAFVGGTSYLGRDEETCLFFPPGDAAMCAFQIERVVKDKELALRLSRGAREISMKRHDRQDLATRQIATYRQVLAQGQEAPVRRRGTAVIQG